MLARETMVLFRECILGLKRTGRLNYSLINILPFDRTIFDNAPLFSGMHDMVCEMCREDAILPCKQSGIYAESDSVKIARNSELTEVFTDDLLTELLDDGNTYHWLPTFITESRREYRNLYNFLTGTMDIRVIRPEDFLSSFFNNTQFLRNRTKKWLVKLYNLYKTVPNLFDPREAGSNMLSVEFIRTEKGNFVSAYREIEKKEETSYSWLYVIHTNGEDEEYVPNVFLPAEDSGMEEGINYVDSYLYKHCKEFFTETLCLKKPEKYEFFIENFRRRYRDADMSSHHAGIFRFLRAICNLF